MHRIDNAVMTVEIFFEKYLEFLRRFIISDMLTAKQDEKLDNFGHYKSYTMTRPIIDDGGNEIEISSKEFLS